MAKGKRLKEPKRRKKAEAAVGGDQPEAAEQQPEPESPEFPTEDTQETPAPAVEEAPGADIPLEVAEGEATEEEWLEEDEAEEGEEKRRLRKGMSRSRRILGRPFARAATRRAIDPQFWEDAEDALIAADAGVESATTIVEAARKRITSEGVRDLEGLRQVFREEVAEMLRSFGERPAVSDEKPHVVFIVGVNGVGKTTTSARSATSTRAKGKRSCSLRPIPFGPPA